ncbi:MAG: NUDIX hydrolase [Terracidiphilus sp.]
MPKKKKADKAAKQENVAVAKSKEKKAAKSKEKKALKKAKVPKKAKEKKVAKEKKAKEKKALRGLVPLTEEKAEVLTSETVFEGPLFRVSRDRLIEPGGKQVIRDVVRHNGSVVILALDKEKDKRDPWVVVERQYRHAANHYLWELPAGKLEPGEDPLMGAKRELVEETGYHARKWKPLIEYYASPGFLGESMIVYVAEGLIAGDAHPEGDEQIDFRLVKLSELLRLIDKGAIVDGKTLTAVLLYARRFAGKGKK